MLILFCQEICDIYIDTEWSRLTTHGIMKILIFNKYKLLYIYIYIKIASRLFETQFESVNRFEYIDISKF